MSLRLLLKPIPDDPRPGVPDPRVLQVWLDAERNPRPPAEGLAGLRASMGWPNLDLSSGVSTEALTLAGRSGPIPARVYRPGAPGVDRPVVVYFHGGGFVGGSLKTVENPCKLLADRAGAVVVSVDYRLAPEAPFPAPLDDCWDAVQAVAARAAEWGGDRRRLAVAGDSAGANLAAACCLLDARAPGPDRLIAAQFLIYPVVDQRAGAQGHLPWSVEAYDIQAHGDRIRPSLGGPGEGMSFFSSSYLGAHPADDPLVSPLLADPASFPSTLLVTAEYDFLRVEGEAFGAQLAAAGVPVRALRYRGLDHAFFDKLGLFPQAADVVSEMAATLAVLGRAEVGPEALARLDFLAEADRLKLVVRQNDLADASRRENTAEHSWHLVLFALVLADYAPAGTDIGHAVRLCAVHDLVEIDAGDTFFWDAKGYEDKEEREQAAATRLFGLLPGAQAAEFRALWDEFEACQTPEALYANAVDRMAPGLLNSRSGGRSWRDHGVTLDKIRGRTEVIGRASPALGRIYESILTNAVEKGFLKP